jgi:hypothetical protein
MGIGTSDGKYYEDEFAHATGSHTTPITGSQNASPGGDTSSAGALKVDRGYEVPYISGLSESGDTLYIDKDVPTKMSISGVTFDPAEPLWIHETVEKHAYDHLIKSGMDKEQAYLHAHHGYAEPAEDNWYRSKGINVKEVDKEWKKLDTKTEDEGTENHPKDLAKWPYPHNKIEGAGHPTQGIFDEWPKVAKGNQPVENMRMPGVHPDLPFLGAANQDPILSTGWEADEETQRRVGKAALQMMMTNTGPTNPFSTLREKIDPTTKLYRNPGEEIHPAELGSK